MKLYFVIAHVVRLGCQIQETNVSYPIRAIDIKQAIGDALLCCLRDYPVSKGYSLHRVRSVEKITKSMIDGCDFDDTPETYLVQ